MFWVGIRCWMGNCMLWLRQSGFSWMWHYHQGIPTSHTIHNVDISVLYQNVDCLGEDSIQGIPNITKEWFRNNRDVPCPAHWHNSNNSNNKNKKKSYRKVALLRLMAISPTMILMTVLHRVMAIVKNPNCHNVPVLCYVKWGPLVWSFEVHILPSFRIRFVCTMPISGPFCVIYTIPVYFFDTSSILTILQMTMDILAALTYVPTFQGLHTLANFMYRVWEFILLGPWLGMYWCRVKLILRAPF